jgi:hypothetical protein
MKNEHVLPLPFSSGEHVMAQMGSALSSMVLMVYLCKEIDIT